MTKSRPSSRNSGRSALRKAAVVSLFCLFIFGCSAPPAPTYTKDKIERTFQKLMKQEYSIDCRVKLAGGTLWVYVPVQDLFEKSQKPERVKEQFEIQENKSALRSGVFHVSYLIRPIPEQEKLQEYGFNKKEMEKINHSWEVLRRIVFSMDRGERDQIQFYCIIGADIKNGLQLSETIYYKDMLKVLYRFISPDEYHHRIIVDTRLSPAIIGDRLGLSVDYRDISLFQFLCDQIEHRVNLKFQKPEVSHGADIDKEIIKTIKDTLRIYEFDNFRSAELFNLFTNKRTVISQRALRRAR
jgi:hypothetical protein